MTAREYMLALHLSCAVLAAAGNAVFADELGDTTGSIGLSKWHPHELCSKISKESSTVTGRDLWGGIRSHIGVVNPIGRDSRDPNVLSLRGEWIFSPRPPGTWRNGAYFHTMYGVEVPGKPWKDARTIRVPGCWEAQGVGAQGSGRPWKCWWDSAPSMLNHQFEGDCLYMKRVTIPKRWKGSRVWLSIGGVNSQGWFWLNDRQVAHVQEYCATRKYDVTDFVTPGQEVKIVAVVSNSAASRRGCFNYYNTWGGILRDIEFQSTPAVFIDDAWVRGNFESREAEAHVEVAGEASGSGVGKVRVEIEGRIAEVAAEPGENVVRMSLPDFRPWSPEHPNLYWAKIELLDADGRVTMVRRERFGVRKLEVRGGDFLLNGEPLFMRGAGWHNIVPVEGVMPPDRERIRRDMRVVRAAGFNQVRLHTECRWPEFFEVADELGLMVMPELPYYTDVPTGDFPFDPIGDATDLWKTLRRHPSFVVYGGGNEGWFGPVLSRWLYDFIKKTDPDRLVFGQDAVQNPRTNGPDVSDIVGGPAVIWPRGCYDPKRPFVCHEYLNFCVKLDARTDRKFSGVWMAPVKYDARKQWLARYDLDSGWGDRLQDAQHELQSYWRRYGLECARADPYCDGYSFWALADVACPQTIAKGTLMERWTQWGRFVFSSEERDPFLAYAAQSVFDPFMETKPKGEPPSVVAEYNSPSCVLMDDESSLTGEGAAWWEAQGGVLKKMWVKGGTNRVHVAGDRFPLTFLFAHYENASLDEARIDWKFVTDDGREFMVGGQEIGRQTVGHARQVARVVFTVPGLPKACKATLVATVSGQAGSKRFTKANHWDWWFFPARTARPSADTAATGEFRSLLLSRYPGILSACEMEKAKTVIVRSGSDEERMAIGLGKNVVSISNWDGKPNVILGRWWMGSQLGMVLTDSQCLAKLPHQGVLNPLLFRIVKEGAVELPLADVKRSDYRIVGEGRDACYLYLSETVLTGGVRRFMVAGLDVVSDTPEGTAILDGILDVMQ